MSALTLFEHRLTIEAPVADVFDLLTTPAGLLRWIAVAAEVERVVDGRITWTHENGATMVGRVVAIEPPRRIVFTYGWEDGAMGVPPESTEVEIVLQAIDDRATELRLWHRNLPAAAEERHAFGWRHFLGELEKSVR